ncbi:hypothetical protein B5X24_HaOG207363 [Helicoverpa armigera]|uniref:Uncharacterized protein n=1 Tax=Helicoverpa armigera TaxID=29058 RepID=A0A2W1BM03_HELAM|nr:hypothetical protein B5X24_HaOG207363 [Helicoverpa armigera]
MAKLCPLLAPKYYEHLMNDKGNYSPVRNWDLMMGSNSLVTFFANLQKEIDRKNGIPEPEKVDPNELFHMQIDL